MDVGYNDGYNQGLLEGHDNGWEEAKVYYQRVFERELKEAKQGCKERINIMIQWMKIARSLGIPLWKKMTSGRLMDRRKTQRKWSHKNGFEKNLLRWSAQGFHQTESSSKCRSKEYCFRRLRSHFQEVIIHHQWTLKTIVWLGIHIWFIFRYG